MKAIIIPEARLDELIDAVLVRLELAHRSSSQPADYSPVGEWQRKAHYQLHVLKAAIKEASL